MKKVLSFFISLLMCVSFITVNTSAATNHISVTYQTYDHVYKRFLTNVTDTNGYAGIFGQAVDGVYANLSQGSITYKVHVKGSNWLPEVVNRTDYAGIKGQPIDGLMVKTNTGRKIKYRVHVMNGDWLPYVDGYNTGDSNNGYAGSFGKVIDAIQMYVEDTAATVPTPTSTPKSIPTNTNTISITGESIPTEIYQGSTFSVKGKINSNSLISSVNVQVLDSNGVIKTQGSATVNNKYYDLSVLDRQIRFNDLTQGVKTYRVTAYISGKKVNLVDTKFTVFANQPLSDGEYTISPQCASNMTFDVVDGKSDGKIQLYTKVPNEKNQKFTLKHLGKNYYAIACCTQNVLDVTNGIAKTGTLIQQYPSNSTDAQKWFIEYAGDGYYYIVSKKNLAMRMDVINGSNSIGAKIQLYDSDLVPVNTSPSAQRFKFNALSTSLSTNNNVANVSYSSSVTAVTKGQIRYITQNPLGNYFNSDYWGPNDQTTIECGTTCISMALSYIGVNKTPKEILILGNGITYFGKNYGTSKYSYGTFEEQVNKLLTPGANYSPVILHINSYSNLGHYVLLIGKVSENEYKILDPWQDGNGPTTWNMKVVKQSNGSYNVSYTKPGGKYCSETTNEFSSCCQYYIP